MLLGVLYVKCYLVYVSKYLNEWLLPETVPLRTVNRQCSSGLQAVADVAASIKAGFYDIGRSSKTYFRCTLKLHFLYLAVTAILFIQALGQD